MVLSLARSTIFSSTTASSSNCNVHRLRPLGGREQANAINFASAAPSKMRGLAEAGECFLDQDGLEPFFHQLLTGPCHRVDAGIQGRRNLAVTSILRRLPEASAFNRMRAFVSSRAECLLCMYQRVEPLPLIIVELHHIPSSRQSVSRSRYISVIAGAIDLEIHRGINDGGHQHPRVRSLARGGTASSA